MGGWGRATHPPLPHSQSAPVCVQVQLWRHEQLRLPETNPDRNLREGPNMLVSAATANVAAESTAAVGAAPLAAAAEPAAAVATSVGSSALTVGRRHRRPRVRRGDRLRAARAGLLPQVHAAREDAGAAAPPPPPRCPLPSHRAYRTPWLTRPAPHTALRLGPVGRWSSLRSLRASR